MKKGLANPSKFVPYSMAINKVADFFMNAALYLRNEDIGAARRVSGYETAFYDITHSGTTYDVMASCKIQRPDGTIGEVVEDVSWVPNNLMACWRARREARELLRQKIRQENSQSKAA